jgi:hypothetical protein
MGMRCLRGRGRGMVCLAAVEQMRIGLWRCPAIAVRDEPHPAGFVVSNGVQAAGPRGTVLLPAALCFMPPIDPAWLLGGGGSLATFAGACPPLAGEIGRSPFMGHNRGGLWTESMTGRSTSIGGFWVGEQLGEAKIGLGLGRPFPTASNRTISALSF